MKILKIRNLIKILPSVINFNLIKMMMMGKMKMFFMMEINHLALPKQEILLKTKKTMMKIIITMKKMMKKISIMIKPIRILMRASRMNKFEKK